MFWSSERIFPVKFSRTSQHVVSIRDTGTHGCLLQGNICISKKENDDKNTINLNTFKKVWNTRHRTGRLCGDIEMSQKHVLSKENAKKTNPCEVCGIYSYIEYGICKALVNYFPQKGGQKSQH